ncbi:hypothetical protein Pyn_10107 [Prunus yedoensis var. nudiflora]|uniref:Uncharacterized protein n=1 Tax=Prunus yedoensis var. nudiflora TaxID=2094558 RepID=A0A314XXQ0_PRUYE|nr:hypothetical protein Pyn_10107 [Prunus yedoensis var. nudiflora]
MTRAGVAGMMFQCAFEGSLSMQDTEIERRPYHKNCTCALHKFKVVLAPTLVKGTYPSQRNIHGVMVPCACRHHQLPNSPPLLSATCPCPLPHLQETEKV